MTPRQDAYSRGKSIHIRTDKRIGCPIKGCRVEMGLTKQGVEMALAQGLKCREHGERLVEKP